MRYFLLLPLWLLMEVLGAMLWPILPALAVNRYGPVDNDNGYALEPRLPVWLAWFDTPDNSLLGDTGWKTIHYQNPNSYWGMARWLLRNRSVGFSRSVLARHVFQHDIHYTGDPYVSADHAVYGVFQASDGRGVWQYKRVFPLFGKTIGLNFGWLMDAMVKDLSDGAICHYKVSVKIKDLPKDQLG